MAGFGISYLTGVALTLEDRIVFGVVLGAIAVAAAGFVPSLLFRDVTPATVLIGLAVSLGGAAYGLSRSPGQLVTDLADAGRRWSAPPNTPGHPWPLLAVVLVCGGWTIYFFHQAFVYPAAGLFAG